MKWNYSQRKALAAYALAVGAYVVQACVDLLYNNLGTYTIKSNLMDLYLDHIVVDLL